LLKRARAPPARTPRGTQSVGEAALAESALALEAGAARLAALDTRVRAAWAEGAGATLPDGVLSALAAHALSPARDAAARERDAWEAEAQADADAAADAAASGQLGLEEMSAALALTQQARAGGAARAGGTACGICCKACVR
jgi:hypothetical protein